MKYSNHQTK